jgi:uncharacterized protein (DUF1501 family)
MNWHRRELLLAGGAALGAMALQSRAIAQSSPTADVLVVIFLRGGCDALNFVAPVNDAHYIAARPAELRVQESGEQAGLSLGNAPTNQDFRLHPTAPELKELYDSGHLAIVHACGLTNGTRSHFDATDFMERGTVNDKGLTTGWLTRHLAQQTASALPAVAIAPSLPGSLLNCNVATALPNLDSYALPGDDHYQATLQKFYGAAHRSTCQDRRHLSRSPISALSYLLTRMALCNPTCQPTTPVIRPKREPS